MVCGNAHRIHRVFFIPLGKTCNTAVIGRKTNFEAVYSDVSERNVGSAWLGEAGVRNVQRKPCPAVGS